MATNNLLLKLATIYAGDDIRYPQLRAVTLAQWMLESGRATSKLAKLHYNFGGIKWRAEMAAYATKVKYEANDGVDFYCKFATIENYIAGYWAFLDRTAAVLATITNCLCGNEHRVRQLQPARRHRLEGQIKRHDFADRRRITLGVGVPFVKNFARRRIHDNGRVLRFGGDEPGLSERLRRRAEPCRTNGGKGKRDSKSQTAGGFEHD